ncbi:MAG: replicative DNA helicase [bacterium]|nr:replicative DNA helicase [bacterium]
MSDPLLERIPPQSLEAEQSVLGALLISPDAVTRVAELLRPDMFYRAAHGTLFQHILGLAEKGEPVDLVTVSAALRSAGVLDEVGGYSYLMDLAAGIPTAANVEYYAKIVEQKSLLRALITAGTKIVEIGYTPTDQVDEVLDQAEQTIFDVAEGRRQAKAVSHIKDILKDTFQTIEERYENQSPVMGHETGYYDLDQMMSGVHPSDLVVLAARPAMGKTSFALNLALNVAKLNQLPVLVFSLEMSKEQLAQRLICSEARIDQSRIRTGFLSESDWPKLTEALGALEQAPIYIDDTPAITVMEVRGKARRLKALERKELGLIVIDYLQLMSAGRGSDGNRVQEISMISRNLKALARELQVPIVALSQLSRAVESRTDKRPMLSDLRESGAIEQDADIVMFIYRDEYYNPDSLDKNIAEVIIAKHRNGPVGIVKLFFEKTFTRFENLSQESSYAGSA